MSAKLYSITLLLIGILLPVCEISAQPSRKFREVAADYEHVLNHADSPLTKGRSTAYFSDTLLFELSEEQEGSRFFLNAQTLLAFAYVQRAISSEPVSEFSQLKHFADSARYLLDFAHQALDKKEIRKNQNYYSILSKAVGKNDSKVTLGQTRKRLMEADTLLQEVMLQASQMNEWAQKSKDAYNRAVGLYEVFVQKYAERQDIYLLDEGILEGFAARTFSAYDSAEYYFGLMQRLSEKYPGNAVLPQRTYRVPREYPFVMDAVENVETTTWHWVDLSKWFDELQKHRSTYLSTYRNVLDAYQRTFIAKIRALEEDSLTLSVPFQIDRDTLSFLQDYEKQSLPLALFQYQEAYVNLLSSMIGEDSYFNYEANREAVMNYYFGLKTEVSEVRKRIDKVWAYLNPSYLDRHQAFIGEHYGSEKGLRNYLAKQEKNLNAKLFYCNIRIKDQLIYKYLEKSYFPKYAEYEEQKIALFEQSPDLVVASGAYVTTQVIQQANEYYVTGFQKNGKKHPFVAKIVGKEVQWLKMLEMPLPNDAPANNGYGIVMTPVHQGCLLIVRAYQQNIHRDSAAVNILYELDEEGEKRHQVILKQKLFPEYSVKNEQDTSYVIAYRSKSGSREKLPEMLISNVGLDGDATWSVEYPVDGNFTRLLKYDDDYLVVSNVVNLRDSNGNLIKTQQRGRVTSNIFVAIFSKTGETMHRRFLRSGVSHFATNAFVQEDGNILVLGFKGDYNLNALSDRPLLNLLFDEGLNVLVSNLEKDLP